MHSARSLTGVLETTDGRSPCTACGTIRLLLLRMRKAQYKTEMGALRHHSTKEQARYGRIREMRSLRPWADENGKSLMGRDYRYLHWHAKQPNEGIGNFAEPAGNGNTTTLNGVQSAEPFPALAQDGVVGGASPALLMPFANPAEPPKV